MERLAAPADVARSVGVSVDSIGRYAREGRIPYSLTPGGHRRFNIAEVLHALRCEGAPTGAEIFRPSPSTLRRRAIRSVQSQANPGDERATPAEPSVEDGGDSLLRGAWRVQRSTHLAKATL